MNRSSVKMEVKRKAEEEHKDDEKPQPPSNKGTLIVDATCVPSQIKYPRDVELLNEAREKLEEIVDVLHTPEDGKKPRMYRQNARKQYLSIAAARKIVRRKYAKQCVNSYNTFLASKRSLQYSIRMEGHLPKNISAS